ncbi:MAG: hypothetical protein D6791_16720 [Chloroflexi bacterium]|nr:MAG: hypothetical protein D6791_16720 [Chloroflexota bacterium]
MYFSQIVPAAPSIEPVLLISNPEAQEPASAAVSPDGHIMITMEDGWNTQREVAQRYGVYDTTLGPTLPYPQMVADGGHSGHVTASGNRFVVFYSEGWVEGGGVDNLGSGDDVWVAVYTSEGKLNYTLAVAVGDDSRDWWPLISGSPERALLIWQRFAEGETYSNLMFSLLDVYTGLWVENTVLLEKKMKYYTHSVAFIPSIARFLVTGAYDHGGGFAFLLDSHGNVVAANTNLPAPMREANIIVRDSQEGIVAVEAIAPSGMMVLSISADRITLTDVQEDDYEWRYSGVDGIFLSPDKVYMVATSPAGLIERIFDIVDE